MIRIFVLRMNSSQAIVLKEKYLGEKLRNIRELQGCLGSFFYRIANLEEILAKRVLKIGPNGFSEVIVKWWPNPSRFVFF